MNFVEDKEKSSSINNVIDINNIISLILIIIFFISIIKEDSSPYFVPVSSEPF